MKLGFSLNVPCDETMDYIARQLGASGWEVTVSFDLQSARRALAYPLTCLCPYHGTPQCDCQYRVLLVNRPGEEADSIVAHGHDRRTELMLVPAAGDSGAGDLALHIRAALRELTQAHRSLF